MKITFHKKVLSASIQMAVIGLFASQMFVTSLPAAQAQVVPADHKAIPVCTYLHGFENFPKLTFLLEEKWTKGTTEVRKAEPNDCVAASYPGNTVKLYAVNSVHYAQVSSNAAYVPSADESAYPAKGELKVNQKIVPISDKTEYEKYDYSLDGIDNNTKYLIMSFISSQTNLMVTDGLPQTKQGLDTVIKTSENQSVGTSEIVKPFSDVPLISTYYTAINYLKKNNLVNGYSDGTFRPELRINRAEFTKIIIGATQSDSAYTKCLEKYSNQNGSYRNIFTDVITSKNAWYLNFICYAKDQNLIDGYADGSFKPNQEISFAEASKIIANAFKLSSGAVGTPWYSGYVKALDAQNAIPTTISRFDEKITRGEMAEIIYRLKSGYKNLPSKTYADLQ